MTIEEFLDELQESQRIRDSHQEHGPYSESLGCLDDYYIGTDDDLSHLYSDILRSSEIPENP